MTGRHLLAWIAVGLVAAGCQPSKDASVHGPASVAWERTFGGAQDDEARYLIRTDDGGVMLAGVTKSKGAGDDNAWLLRLDAEGHLLWDQAFGGARYDNAHAVARLGGGRCVFSGRTYSKGEGGEDAWIVNVIER